MQTDWAGVSGDRETHRGARWIKEAIWIRAIAPTTNGDETFSTQRCIRSIFDT